MGAKPVFEEKKVGHGPDAGGKIAEEFFHETILMAGMGISAPWKLFLRHPLTTVCSIVGMHYASCKVVFYKYHLKFISSMAPEFLTLPRLEKLSHHLSITTQELTVFGCFLVPPLIVAGIYLRFMRTKYQKIFKGIGLINGEGETPIFVSSQKLDAFRTSYRFDSKHIGKSKFEEKTEELEAAFEQALDSIGHGRTQRYIDLIFTTHRMPEKVTFQELCATCSLFESEFIIGDSAGGTVKHALGDLPHLLIAGTTGAGKSNFFKQVLVALLKSKHIQVYLVDLKDGLEAVDFEAAPNVSIVHTIAEAIQLLSKVKLVMEERFKFMKENRLKSIVPTRDKLDRIVIAIDECSVLFMKRSRQDPDYENAIRARELLDSLSKLSRAAGINLILATQKIDSETVPTSVQQNINGRMVFKANTLASSMSVLGNGEACKLPDLRGRGIWKVGNKEIIVQTPFITDAEVEAQAASVLEEFKAGTRSLHQPLIELTRMQPATRSKALDAFRKTEVKE